MGIVLPATLLYDVRNASKEIDSTRTRKNTTAIPYDSLASPNMGIPGSNFTILFSHQACDRRKASLTIIEKEITMKKIRRSKIVEGTTIPGGCDLQRRAVLLY